MMPVMFTRFSIIGLVSLWLTFPALAQRTTRDIYDQNKSAVVLLLAYDSRSMLSALGSGFYFETNKIASNFHVIEGASRIMFRVIGSKEMHAVKRVISFSTSLDLAILEVEQEHQPVKIASLDKLGVGDKVVAIGNPRGLEGSVSEGIVSAIRGSGDVQMLQITAPISPGSSGGPLFSAEGQVVGVTTATLRDSQSLNFAVPASLLSTLRNKGNGWEPIVSKDMPAPEKGSGGVKLLSPDFEDVYGTVQFSLLNNNKRAIANVAYLLIFRDTKSGEVLHFVTRSAKDLLPPGLAKRFSFKESSLKGFMLRERYPYKLGDGYLTALVEIELKLLTYDFVGDTPDSSILDVLQK
ncbi:MAG: serine protease [Pedosphaera sp.]|nr:serine protease [Pedosphaera sp.]